MKLTKKEFLFLLFLIFLYLSPQVFEINLPGVHFDEVSAATGTIDILKGRDCTFLISGPFFNRRIPS